MATNLEDRNGVWLKDNTGLIVLARGTTVPTDATSGYAIGGIFMDTDGAAGSQFYINSGTATSSAFVPMDTGGREIAAGAASLTVTKALHDGKTILLDQATGTAVTLPAMTGSGARFRFVVTATKSGGSDVITATGAHLFGGMTMNTDTTAGTLFTCVAAANAGGSTTITLDGTTKGGRKGDWFEIEDCATSIGIVRGSLNGSGTEATPFA